MEGLTLFRLRAGDEAAIAALLAAAPEAAPWSAESCASFAAAGEGWLARRAGPEGEAAGFIAARIAADECEILNLAVAPAHRRRGIARRLVERALSEARGAGARRCWLEVRASNAGAIAFYRAMGFGAAGLRRGYYSAPVEDALVMTRTLA